MTKTPEIKIDEFSKAYQVKNASLLGYNDFVAVNKLSFAVQSGEVFALLGVNGAGKSTTFKALTSQVRPTNGTVSVCGYDL